MINRKDLPVGRVRLPDSGGGSSELDGCMHTTKGVREFQVSTLREMNIPFCDERPNRSRMIDRKGRVIISDALNMHENQRLMGFINQLNSLIANENTTQQKIDEFINNPDFTLECTKMIMLNLVGPDEREWLWSHINQKEELLNLLIQEAMYEITDLKDGQRCTNLKATLAIINEGLENCKEPIRDELRTNIHTICVFAKKASIFPNSMGGKVSKIDQILQQSALGSEKKLEHDLTFDNDSTITTSRRYDKDIEDTIEGRDTLLVNSEALGEVAPRIEGRDALLVNKRNLIFDNDSTITTSRRYDKDIEDTIEGRDTLLVNSEALGEVAPRIEGRDALLVNKRNLIFDNDSTITTSRRYDKDIEDTIEGRDTLLVNGEDLGEVAPRIEGRDTLLVNKRNLIFDNDSTITTSRRYDKDIEDTIEGRDTLLVNGEDLGEVAPRIEGRDTLLVNGEDLGEVAPRIEGRDTLLVNSEALGEVAPRIEGRDTLLVNGEDLGEVAPRIEGRDTLLVNSEALGEIAPRIEGRDALLVNSEALGEVAPRIERRDTLLVNKRNLIFDNDSTIATSRRYDKDIEETIAEKKTLPTDSSVEVSRIPKVPVNGGDLGEVAPRIEGRDALLVNKRNLTFDNDSTITTSRRYDQDIEDTIEGRDALLVNSEDLGEVAPRIEGRDTLLVNKRNLTFDNDSTITTSRRYDKDIEDTIEGRDTLLVNSEALGEVAPRIEGRDALLVNKRNLTFDNDSTITTSRRYDKDIEETIAEKKTLPTDSSVEVSRVPKLLIDGTDKEQTTFICNREGIVLGDALFMKDFGKLVDTANRTSGKEGVHATHKAYTMIDEAIQAIREDNNEATYSAHNIDLLIRGMCELSSLVKKRVNVDNDWKKIQTVLLNDNYKYLVENGFMTGGEEPKHCRKLNFLAGTVFGSIGISDWSRKVCESYDIGDEDINKIEKQVRERPIQSALITLSNRSGSDCMVNSSVALLYKEEWERQDFDIEEVRYPGVKALLYLIKEGDVAKCFSYLLEEAKKKHVKNYAGENEGTGFYSKQEIESIWNSRCAPLVKRGRIIRAYAELLKVLPVTSRVPFGVLFSKTEEDPNIIYPSVEVPPLNIDNYRDSLQYTFGWTNLMHAGIADYTGGQLPAFTDKTVGVDAMVRIYRREQFRKEKDIFLNKSFIKFLDHHYIAVMQGASGEWYEQSSFTGLIPMKFNRKKNIIESGTLFVKETDTEEQEILRTAENTRHTFIQQESNGENVFVYDWSPDNQEGFPSPKVHNHYSEKGGTTL